MHAKFLNFDTRESSQFSDVEHFMQCYQSMLALGPSIGDQVFDEFVGFQLLEDGDIPQSVWESATELLEENSPKDQAFVRMDVIWAFLSSMKAGDGYSLKFPHLSRIARLVLVLPHSNAGEEHVFSLIRLNKTPYRSSLGLDSTLSSILTVKLHNPEPCYKFETYSDMLSKSKKVTGSIIRNTEKSNVLKNVCTVFMCTYTL